MKSYGIPIFTEFYLKNPQKYAFFKIGVMTAKSQHLADVPILNWNNFRTKDLEG